MKICLFASETVLFRPVAGVKNNRIIYPNALNNIILR